MSGIISFLLNIFNKFLSSISCNSKPAGQSTEIDITVKENDLESGTGVVTPATPITPTTATQIYEEKVYFKCPFWN
jgi:hypothetical protein